MELQSIETPTHRRPPDTNLSAAEVDAEVGRRLRVYRVMAGMSQQRLGDLIGVSFQQIQKYERAANRVSVGRLVRIAEILGVDPVDLLPDSGPNRITPDPDPSLLHIVRKISTIRTPGFLEAIKRVLVAFSEAEQNK